MAAWVAIVLPAGPMADEAAALLAELDELAAQGVHVRGTDIVLYCPLEDAPAHLERLAPKAISLREAGFDTSPESMRTEPLPPEEEWRDSWKRYFKVERLSPRLVIVPSWESYTPGPTDLVLDLDPGRAFGTGAHGSTLLCLLELDRLAAEMPSVSSFFDCGCGSGILAIAAAKFWPKAQGLAMDVDPEAVVVARENLERNKVLDRVRTSHAPLAELGGPFPLVVANIELHVLSPIAPELAPKVAPGGRLILSGLLEGQDTTLVPIYEKLGLRLVRLTPDAKTPEWISLTFERP